MMLPAEYAVHLAQLENDRDYTYRRIGYWDWLARASQLTDLLQDAGLAPIDPPEAG